ncbi:MAG: helix-turn-helix transcriptional regulator [Clostridia bacterium]|nr:helix-turn-helix transcriptional regulator [Clostridia bacterium]
MFDTRKFGGFLSRLRKAADMTQSELADRLSVTRQAVSKWEIGDSFPDVSILLLIAKLFDVTLDELISAGAPTRGEAEILQSVARGGQPMTHEVSDLIGVAPLLRPSVLDRLSAGLAGQGIDISNLVELAEFLSDERTLALMEGTALDAASPDFWHGWPPFSPPTPVPPSSTASSQARSTGISSATSASHAHCSKPPYSKECSPGRHCGKHNSAKRCCTTVQHPIFSSYILARQSPLLNKSSFYIIVRNITCKNPMYRAIIRGRNRVRTCICRFNR